MLHSNFGLSSVKFKYVAAEKADDTQKERKSKCLVPKIGWNFLFAQFSKVNICLRASLTLLMTWMWLDWAVWKQCHDMLWWMSRMSSTWSKRQREAPSWVQWEPLLHSSISTDLWPWILINNYFSFYLPSRWDFVFILFSFLSIYLHVMFTVDFLHKRGMNVNEDCTTEVKLSNDRRKWNYY